VEGRCVLRKNGAKYNKPYSADGSVIQPDEMRMNICGGRCEEL
jgi:hypothetical protein